MILFAFATFLTFAQARAEVDNVTVPLIVEGNRPFVDLTFKNADGAAHTARFLVDSGGGGFLLTEPLAKELGLSWGTPQREEGKEFAVVTAPPQASVGEIPLKLNPQRVLVVLATDNILPAGVPGHADGMLPAHVLWRYHVVFDYPNSKFTIARPGVIKPEGDELPMPVSPQSGFPRTEIEVDGQKLGFLLDTGAAYTMVSEVLLKSWGNKHPEWERHEGAFGDAKLLGGQTLETMILPEIRWGKNRLRGVGVTSQREGTFEKWMSSMTKEPIVGSLAGNVLKQFRVELDYRNEKLYLSSP
jgi:predicted aspartyl protease